MKSKNITFTSIQELKSSIRDKAFEDGKGLLVQFFCAKTEIDFIKEVQEFFQKKFPQCSFIGATTDGVIDNDQVYPSLRSVINFTYFDKTFLRTTTALTSDFDNGSFACGRTLMEDICTKRTKAVIAFADGLHTNGEEFLQGCSSYNQDIIITGGLAGDNGEFKKTFVFDKEAIIDKGAVAVALDSTELFVATHYSFDWMPIGKKMKVTKAKGNRVYELDGERIVDVYEKYLGKEVAKLLPKIGIEIPLILEKNGMIIGRSVLAKHEDGSLMFAGNVEEGAEVRFGVGHFETIMKRNSQHIQKLLSSLKHKSEAIFIYSCMARRRFLDTMAKKEFEAVAKVANVSGFFTYGEFFHFHNQNQFLNETMTFLALSENMKRVDDEDIYQMTKNQEDYKINTIHAVAYLANAVSKELSELNDTLEEKVAKSVEYIQHQAFYDMLTMLPNRTSLINDLKKEEGKTIILVNIDNFATINDFYGHVVGDEVLLQVALILRQYCNSTNKIYKLSADEFAIISQTKWDNKKEIKAQIKRIIDLIEQQYFNLANHKIHISITVSAAAILTTGAGLINADMALKLAKRTNRKFVIFNEELQLSKQIEKNMQIVHLIKNAIKNDGIVPFFQPIVDIKTDKVIKYEALIRIIDEKGEIHSPFTFLEASKKLKFYPQLMRAMVEKTFKKCASKDVCFSINLTFDDILDADFIRFLFDLMDKYDNAKKVTVEILETQSVRYEESLQNFVNKVYEKGANIAIDDFGSGYANFEHIINIKCDYLKIDGSLIRNLDTDKNAGLIVETILVFAKKLGKKTVAEFVHSKEILEIVKKLGIDYVQGYYLGKPEPFFAEVRSTTP